jgi:hypothetical protein
MTSWPIRAWPPLPLRTLPRRALVGVVPRVVLRRHDQVLPLLVPAWGVAQVEQPPHRDLAHVALRFRPLELRVQLVDARPHVVLSAARLLVLPGIQADLEGGGRVLLHLLGRHLENGLRLGKVVVL